MSKEDLVDLVLETQSNLREHSLREDKKAVVHSKINEKLQQALLYVVIGKRLSVRLGQLLLAVKGGKRPYFGQELAETLDAIHLKLVGYKRWLILIGIIATLPGFVSVALLWQQNLAVAETKNNKIHDIRTSERVILLATIYSTYDKTDYGMLSTPTTSAVNRRNAVLRLIQRDADDLERLEDKDLLNINRMVDIGVAPLSGVDFSPLEGERIRKFKNVGFVNSKFEYTSFDQCQFDFVWFSSALLWNTSFRDAVFHETDFEDASLIGTDFTGAEFYDCSFKNSEFDATTIWPKGFDPILHGAIPLDES